MTGQGRESLIDLIALAKGVVDEPNSTLKRTLEAIRRHLGMQVAYVSEFVDGRSFFREVDAPGLEALIKVGDSHSLDDVYCRHILEGRLPELIPDTSLSRLQWRCRSRRRLALAPISACDPASGRSSLWHVLLCRL